MAVAEYRHEEIAAVPRGYHVRTIRSGEHDIHVAFPPGRRRRGSGVLVSILHPHGENPGRCKNAYSSVYSYSVSLGYPYLRGEGRVAADGRTWLSRVTKKADGSGPALFVGWDSVGRKWIVEREESNPAHFDGNRNPSGRTYEAAGKSFQSRAKAEKYAKAIEKTSGIRVPVYETTGASENPFDWREQREHGGSGSLFDSIRHGDRVTFVDRFGKSRTGRAVMRGPGGWVLNMGGAHGTPQVVNEDMVTRVRGSNPGKGPRKGESAPAYHERRVRELLAKMPKPIRDVFDRNPASYKFVFRNPNGELSAAEDLYKKFHGRAPTEILELQESAEQRGEYVALGDLVELILRAPNGDEVQIKFPGDGVRLASSPEGTQLYLLGGNQDISGHLRVFGGDTSKDLIDLGDAKRIVYEAAKWQTNFSPQEWKHDFGEESGVRPRGFYDQLKQRLFFAGGNYQVKRPGIVD